MVEPASPPELLPGDLEGLAIFPLPKAVLFPGALLKLHIFEPRYRQMTRDVLGGRRMLAMTRLKPGFENDDSGCPPVFEICGVGNIVEFTELTDGRYNITLLGLSRVRILEELPPERPYRMVRAERLEDRHADPPIASAWQRQVVSIWHKLGRRLPELDGVGELVQGSWSAGKLADRLAAAVIADADEAQRLLEECDPAERLRSLVERLQELADALSIPSNPTELN